MARTIEEEKAALESASTDLGIDFRSQVYCSTDDVMRALLEALDRSDDSPVAGLTKRVLPQISLNGGGHGVQTTLAPNTTVEWHCHKKHLVLHEVTQGHVILERRKRDRGRLVVTEDGRTVRENVRLELHDFWLAPPGEPYAYFAEDEVAATTYRHLNDPGQFPPVTGCADPDATPEDP